MAIYITTLAEFITVVEAQERAKMEIERSIMPEVEAWAKSQGITAHGAENTGYGYEDCPFTRYSSPDVVQWNKQRKSLVSFFM